MKHVFIPMIAVLAATLSPAVFPANVWENGMPVLSVIGLANGGFVLMGPENSAPACGANGSQFYVQPSQNGQTAAGVSAALAIALSAIAMGRSVTLLYDDASSACYVQIVQLSPE